MANKNIAYRIELTDFASNVTTVEKIRERGSDYAAHALMMRMRKAGKIAESATIQYKWKSSDAHGEYCDVSIGTAYTADGLTHRMWVRPESYYG